MIIMATVNCTANSANFCSCMLESDLDGEALLLLRTGTRVFERSHSITEQKAN